ncbi:extracellular solute-binding protein family 3 [Pseudogulbenkiania sp. NH8B]|uniref:substrate-binding periplasmic protein n=1 Tax=Pseudogulbenkiania sp. (strain NH8B) TaxID=748280 RepID=UPI0002279F56|nr:transporter substrate-binding domain-containing protein [Pseudogulbenkiania sp. NH8B]BAK76700.1 extracellular solute-binding protein family 3 [Pseudogulbenkiania sp. NH8B]
MNTLLRALMVSLCLSALPLAAVSAPSIRLASDNWCPYICAQDSTITGGFMVELTGQIVSAAGYRLESLLMPLNRAMTLAEERDIDGVYAAPIDDRLVLSRPLAFSRACFYTLQHSTWRYTGQASLRTVPLGVIADYGYDGGAFDAYLQARRHAAASLLDFNRGQNAGETNLNKLLTGRYPVAVEHEAVMRHLVLRQKIPPDRVRNAGCLEGRLKLVIGIGKNNPRGRQLIRAIDDGMRKIRASGQLDRLREKYHLDPSP